ncbi:Angiotensin-converting enzyme [Orchesella cincta]|uniref:Angiotensin-converting enzyme n=1 Tax=Orchesella cincta TaxID=48709 RepID=A0A1D2N3B6_ORCCI|nr:Angiotensin-converting enzyme [Orchesella cincta]
MRVLLLAYLQTVAIQCSPTVAPALAEIESYTLAPDASPIEIEALNFIKEVNKKSSKAYNNLAVISWNYETNITDETEAAKATAEANNYKFEADIQKQVQQRFPNWEDFKDDELKRMFANFAIQGPGNMSTEHISKMTEILNKMETAYSTVTICDYHDKTKCNLRLDRGIYRREYLNLM